MADRIGSSLLVAAACASALLAAAASASAAGSRVTSLTVQGHQTLDGGYERVYGLARGVVSGSEHVRGLPAAGLRYAVQYELIGPSPRRKTRLLLVEGENRGSPVVLNVHGMARGRLPASRRFALGPHPRTGPGFNGLPGVTVPVPRTDGASQPVGGVRFPELGLPLGRLKPVSLSPAMTTSAGAVCGNSGGFTPFPAATVIRRSSRSAYLGRYAKALTGLERAGYVRSADRAAMLRAAGAGYAGAVRVILPDLGS